jgi:molybdopterin molybdotransferase
MISIEQAHDTILANIPLMPVVEVPLAKALSRVLAVDITSDTDLPPFDNSAMDGFAVRSDDVGDLPVELEVLETITAGITPRREVGPGQASAIMTGAPLPAGADTIVIVEETEAGSAEGTVRVLAAPAPGHHIRRQGDVLKKGEVVLPAGTWIRPAETAVLATAGQTDVSVRKSPTVAVITTGDEIVAAEDLPTGAQIRDSNSWSTHARLRLMRVEADMLGIVTDDEEDLRKAIAEGLRHDLLILSGGVSAGIADLVPDMLEKAGVELLFRKVSVQPGKPVVFGRHDGGLVFGLPGNPVSTQVIMELFVVPAIRAMMGMTDPLPQFGLARLAEDLTHHGRRTLFQPVRLRVEGEDVLADPVSYGGSGDFVGYARADALVVMPEGRTEYPAGSVLRVLRLPGC